MKVSNGINVTSIYQEQVKKAQANKTNDATFGNMLTGAVDTKTAANNVADASALQHAAKANIGGLSFGDVAPKAVESDPVEVFKHVAGIVASAPETRAEKVDRIKALYEAGQYNVSAEAVAEKLWASGIMSVSFEG